MNLSYIQMMPSYTKDHICVNCQTAVKVFSRTDDGNSLFVTPLARFQRCVFAGMGVHPCQSDKNRRKQCEYIRLDVGDE